MYNSHETSHAGGGGASETDLDLSLREGLRAIPVPSAASDFDARVLAQLSQTLPWWRAVGPWILSLRPAMTAAAASLPVMIGLIAWFGQTPAPSANPVSIPAVTARVLPMDRDLDRPDLSPVMLRALSNQETAARGRRGDTRRPAISPNV